MFRVLGDLEGVAGVVGGEIGNEDQRFSRPLLFVIDRESVDVRFRHTVHPSRAPVPIGCGAYSGPRQHDSRRGTAHTKLALTREARPGEVSGCRIRPGVDRGKM